MKETKQVMIGAGAANRSGGRESEKKERKLAILTRGSVFPSRAASKGKSDNTVQQLSGARAGSH